MLLDLERREEDGPFEVKILEKKWKWVLRRDGATVDHRVGGVFRPSSSFFSDLPRMKEKRASLSKLNLERETF